MRCNIFAFIAMAVTLSCVSASALDLKNITFATGTAGEVIFSHKFHIRQKKMANNCKACHDAIYPFRSKASYSMADMEKGKSCGACHNGTGAFSVQECARCHQVSEITYAVQATGPVRFSHRKHLLSNPNCTACHPSLFFAGHNIPATMADMKQGKSCGGCHDGTTAFGINNCSSCHPVKDRIYVIKGAGRVTFSHTFHMKRYLCGNCHTRLYAIPRSRAKVLMKGMEKGRSCGACHDGKTAFSVKANCASCHKAG